MYPTLNISVFCDKADLLLLLHVICCDGLVLCPSSETEKKYQVFWLYYSKTLN